MYTSPNPILWYAPQNFVLILTSVFILLLPLKTLVVYHTGMYLCGPGRSGGRAHSYAEAAEAQPPWPSLLGQAPQGQSRS